MKEDIKDFLNFVTVFDEIDFEQGLFSFVENFIVQKCKGSSPIFFSISKKFVDEKNKNLFSFTRFIWNRDNVKKIFNEEQLKNIINRYADQSLEKKTPINIENNEGFLCYLGEYEDQYYFLLQKDLNVISEQLKGYFYNFLVSNFRKVLKVKEVTKLEALAHTDDVTGIYNQRKMIRDLNLSIEKYKKYCEEFSVLFIDIDHFKKVNDGYGHLVGTQLLKALGEKLSDTLRDSDHIYRYGGDEFVMIIPGVGSESAKKIGQRLLDSVKKETFIAESEDKKIDFNLSVSIGVANFPKDADTQEKILSIADRMMYHAKEKGRGLVCSTTELFDNGSD